MSSPPLLITATLNAGETPHVALRDIEARTVAHLEGLLAWLYDPAIHRIVFAKNCTAVIHSQLLVEVAANYGKELEFVQTDSFPQTLYQGKGFGEGAIIRQALTQSRMLQESDELIKVTGKLYMPDVGHHLTSKGDGDFFSSGSKKADLGSWRSMLLGPIYQSEQGCMVLGFLRNNMRVPWGLVTAPVKGWIDTRIYRVRRAFYEQHLLNAYRRVHDSLGYTLEAIFYDELNSQHGIHCISDEPVILGTSGTLGTTAAPYTSAIREEARELAAKLLVIS